MHVDECKRNCTQLSLVKSKFGTCVENGKRTHQFNLETKERESLGYQGAYSRIILKRVL